MARTDKPTDLPELLSRYLQRQVSAHEEGLALPDLGGEVEPYDAGPAQPVEPRVAWDESVAVLKLFVPAVKAVKAPPEWGAVVAAQEPLTALPMCAGNYPQMVRDVHALLRGEESKPSDHPIGAEALVDWAERTSKGDKWADAILAVGALRLVRQFDRAAAILEKRDAPVEWKAAWANEAAALAWHRGKRSEAATMWRSQAESVPVLFNRGVAALFLGQAAEARPSLRQAAEKLPESGAWHHLARLYLTLAEMR